MSMTSNRVLQTILLFGAFWLRLGSFPFISGVVHPENEGTLNLRAKTGRNNVTNTECLLVMRDFLYRKDASISGNDHAEWTCLFENEGGKAYELEGLPKNFFSKNKGRIKSGATQLKVSKSVKGRKDGRQVITVKSDSTVEVTEKSIGKSGSSGAYSEDGMRYRSLAQRSGNSKVLVLRVSDTAGNAPTKSATELSHAILASQFFDCSRKLQLHPATDHGTGGVLEVTLNDNVAGKTAYGEVESLVDDYLSHSSFPIQNYDHIMYVLPGSVNFGGSAGYAYVNSYKSVYSNSWGADLPVLMHEIGHNLGMMHSGEGNEPYGDETGMMGAPAYAKRMCFNAAKSWELEWYKEGHKFFGKTSPISWEGKLVGIDDYLNGQIPSSRGYVVIKLETNSADDKHLYLNYNRKKGVNSDVPEKGNQVTIVEGKIGDQSWMIEGLGAGGVRRINNFRGGHDLVIKVCELVQGPPDYARVIIYLDDGVQTMSCNCPSGQAPLMWDILTDDHPTETTWEVVKTSSGAVMHQGGPYTNALDKNSRLEFNSCLPIDEYKFRINDSNGNGICCGGNGKGEFLFGYSNAEVARGGSFGSSAEIIFGSTNKKNFHLSFKTDYWGEDTGWSLTTSGIQIDSAVAGTYGKYETHDIFAIWSSTECHSFVITDLYGDGIYYGYFQVSYGGQVVLSDSGSTWWNSKTVSFGSGCSEAITSKGAIAGKQTEAKATRPLPTVRDEKQTKTKAGETNAANRQQDGIATVQSEKDDEKSKPVRRRKHTGNW